MTELPQFIARKVDDSKSSTFFNTIVYGGRRCGKTYQHQKLVDYILKAEALSATMKKMDKYVLHSRIQIERMGVDTYVSHPNVLITWKKEIEDGMYLVHLDRVSKFLTPMLIEAIDFEVGYIYVASLF